MENTDGETLFLDGHLQLLEFSDENFHPVGILLIVTLLLFVLVIALYVQVWMIMKQLTY